MITTVRYNNDHTGYSLSQLFKICQRNRLTLQFGAVCSYWLFIIMFKVPFDVRFMREISSTCAMLYFGIVSIHAVLGQHAIFQTCHLWLSTNEIVVKQTIKVCLLLTLCDQVSRPAFCPPVVGTSHTAIPDQTIMWSRCVCGHCCSPSRNVHCMTWFLVSWSNMVVNASLVIRQDLNSLTTVFPSYENKGLITSLQE